MVDAIKWHTGRVPYLVWNHDGTQLGKYLFHLNKIIVKTILQQQPVQMKTYAYGIISMKVLNKSLQKRTDTR